MATYNLYCDSGVSGGLGDGSSWTNAFSTLTALSTAQQAQSDAENADLEIHIKGYFENQTLSIQSGTYDSAEAYQISIVGYHGAVINNYGYTADCLILDRNGNSSGYKMQGLNLLHDLVLNANRALQTNFSYFEVATYIEDCVITGFINWGRGGNNQNRNVLFYNLSYIDQTNGQTSSGNATFKRSENCTFDNVSFYYDSDFQPFYIRLFSGGIVTAQAIWFGDYYVNFKNNIIRNSDVVLGGLDFYPEINTNPGTYQGRVISYNNWDNCNFGFVQQDGSTMPLYTGTVSACESAVEMRAKMDVDSVTYETNWGYNETFLDSNLDAFYFQQDETLYNLNAHVGANRYANTATIEAGDNTANTDFDTDTGGEFVTRNTTDAALLIFNMPVIDRARKVRRIKLLAENNAPTEDESITIAFYRTLDGSTTQAAIGAETGLVDDRSGSYDYDYIDEIDKGGGLITLLVYGTYAGAWEIYGVAVEYYCLADKLGDTRTLHQQPDNRLLPLPYSFSMPSELRAYLTDTSKESYTVAEIEAEQTANPTVVTGITYYDDPDNTIISKVTLTIDSEIVDLYTFEED